MLQLTCLYQQSVYIFFLKRPFFWVSIFQEAGMDDSKHGGQTYPEIPRGVLSPETSKGGN